LIPLNVVFAGTPEFAAEHLEAIIASNHNLVAVITQPDKPGKRGKKLFPGAVKLVAEQSGLPLIQPARLTVTDLSGFEIDVLVVVAYGQILKPEVLEYPRYGCVNVHASLLPRWRGAAPIQRSILAGDQQTGITIISMDPGLDTGDMLASKPVDISPEETASSLTKKLGVVGPELLISTLEAIAKGDVNPQPQNDAESTYAKKIEKEEALINWDTSAEEVERQVRAFNPNPIAYTYLNNMRLKVHSACLTDEQQDGAPGTVLTVSNEGVLVACKTSALLITRLQLPIGKGAVLSGRDIMNARQDVVHAGIAFTRQLS